MNYKNEQFKVISESVMEQLGIEEDEDPLEVVPLDLMTDEIVDLKEQIDNKDQYIQVLEKNIMDLCKRVEALERVCYQFKTQKR